MRKYFQISFVLIVFGTIVLFKDLKIDPQNDQDVSSTSNSPTPTSENQSDMMNQSPMQQNNQMGMKKYKDGIYKGEVEDAYYGYVQIQITISGGKITDVVFLQYPNDNRTSIFINSQAMPLLKQELLIAQSDHVDVISGATQTSETFIRSITSILAKLS